MLLGFRRLLLLLFFLFNIVFCFIVFVSIVYVFSSGLLGFFSWF